MAVRVMMGSRCVFRDLLLDEDVKRVSSCELEVDIVAADILNRLQVDGPYHSSVYKCSPTGSAENTPFLFYIMASQVNQVFSTLDFLPSFGLTPWFLAWHRFF